MFEQLMIAMAGKDKAEHNLCDRPKAGSAFRPPFADAGLDRAVLSLDRHRHWSRRGLQKRSRNTKSRPSARPVDEHPLTDLKPQYVSYSSTARFRGSRAFKDQPSARRKIWRWRKDHHALAEG